MTRGYQGMDLELQRQVLLFVCVWQWAVSLTAKIYDVARLNLKGDLQAEESFWVFQVTFSPNVKNCSFWKKELSTCDSFQTKGKKYVALQEFPFDTLFLKCPCDFVFWWSYRFLNLTFFLVWKQFGLQIELKSDYFLKAIVSWVSNFCSISAHLYRTEGEITGHL